MVDEKMAVAIGDDVKAQIFAALRRIDEVPVGATLIDRVSDDDWKDEACYAWDITAGSVDDVERHDPMDFVDGADVAA